MMLANLARELGPSVAVAVGAYGADVEPAPDREEQRRERATPAFVSEANLLSRLLPAGLQATRLERCSRRSCP